MTSGNVRLLPECPSPASHSGSTQAMCPIMPNGKSGQTPYDSRVPAEVGRGDDREPRLETHEASRSRLASHRLRRRRTDGTPRARRSLWPRPTTRPRNRLGRRIPDRCPRLQPSHPATTSVESVGETLENPHEPVEPLEHRDPEMSDMVVESPTAPIGWPGIGPPSNRVTTFRFARVTVET